MLRGLSKGCKDKKDTGYKPPAINVSKNPFIFVWA